MNSSSEYREAIDALASRCSMEGRPFLSDLMMSQEIVEAIQLTNAHGAMPQSAQDTLSIVAAELLRRGMEQA